MVHDHREFISFQVVLHLPDAPDYGEALQFDCAVISLRLIQYAARVCHYFFAVVVPLC